jgi:hypothetical protein
MKRRCLYKGPQITFMKTKSLHEVSLWASENFHEEEMPLQVAPDSNLHEDEKPS